VRLGECEDTLGSAMLSKPLGTPSRKLPVAVLVLAIAGGCVLVWVHAEFVHGSALSPSKCAVCSWASSLATIGALAVCFAVVRDALRIGLAPIVVSYPFCHRLPLSARSPPIAF